MQKHLFAVFLVMYLITLVGNGLIILAIHSDSRLHTPMYFFLSNLSFMDICFTTVIVPNMLVNLLSETKFISYVGCLVQMYFFMALGNTDSYLLASMAIDRLVAICNPFHYDVVMSPRRCLLLLLGSCTISHLHSVLRVLLMSRLSFCTRRSFAQSYSTVQLKQTVAHKRLLEVDLACGQSASLLKEVPGIVMKTIKKTQALMKHAFLELIVS
nr:PREDICTED: olfactory receptor 1L4-like [Bos indicus]